MSGRVTFMAAIDWMGQLAAALNMTLSRYEAYADLQRAYHAETCLCEWDGGYGDDGSQCKRIVPNPHCNQHRAEDWVDRMEVKRTKLFGLDAYQNKDGEWFMISLWNSIGTTLPILIDFDKFKLGAPIEIPNMSRETFLKLDKWRFWRMA